MLGAHAAGEGSLAVAADFANDAVVGFERGTPAVLKRIAQRVSRGTVSLCRIAGRFRAAGGGGAQAYEFSTSQ